MTNRTRIKRIVIVLLALAGGLIIVGFAPWIWLWYDTGRVHQRAGIEAAKEISRWVEHSDIVSTGAHAAWHRNGMPADPTFYYRFTIDRKAALSFISRQTLKEYPSTDGTCNDWRKREEIEAWWQPDQVSVPCYFGEMDGNWIYFKYDPRTFIAYLYVQNT